MDLEILDISSESDDAEIEPQRNDDLDYLFNKYIGPRKSSVTYNTSEKHNTITTTSENLDQIYTKTEQINICNEDNLQCISNDDHIFNSKEMKLDISSDSDQTIIEPQTSPQKCDDLNYLFDKYIGDGKRKTADMEQFSLETKDSNFFEEDKFQDYSKSKKFKSAFAENLTEEINDLICKPLKENQKLHKERLRQEKLKLKEQKKKEDQEYKEMKNALAKLYGNMKPENCINFIKVHIDENLGRENFLKFILEELEKNGVSYTTIKQEVSSIITWKMQLDTHILNSNGQLIDPCKQIKIEELLLIMKWEDFLIHVHNNTLNMFIKNIYIKYTGVKIILAIIGLQKYYQYQKRNKNREFKEDINERTSRNNRDQRIYGNIPLVSRKKVEYGLTELQLFYSVSHKMVETEKDLAMFVFQLTKAVAQGPYKKQKQEQYMQSRWYIPGAKKNVIRIDKKGNGLSRLWKQMITKFPLASLETAEAIAVVYPTPLSLFEMYELLNESDGEKLLQDIPIRRGAGPICIMRKIGPELSRKIYNFFTAIDPDKLL